MPGDGFHGQGDWFHGQGDRFLGQGDGLLFCQEIGSVDREMGFRFSRRWITLTRILALSLPGDWFYGHENGLLVCLEMGFIDREIGSMDKEIGSLVKEMGSSFARRLVLRTGKRASGLPEDGLHGQGDWLSVCQEIGSMDMKMGFWFAWRWFHGQGDRFLGQGDGLLFCQEICSVDWEMGYRFARRWITWTRRLALSLPGDLFYGHENGLLVCLEIGSMGKEIGSQFVRCWVHVLLGDGFCGGKLAPGLPGDGS